MASSYVTENAADHQDCIPREKTQPLLRKKPVDQWSVRERLALASAVCQSGDQNWVSVSRAIRPFAEPGRRSDWFSQKNCALQYADLLEKVETPKRKRSERGEIIETPGMQIVRKLTVDRLEEIKSASVDFHRQYRKLKTEIEMVNSGHCDEKLAEIWEQIQLRCKEKEEKAAAAQRALDEDRRVRAAQKGRQLQHGGNVSAEFDDSSTQDSALSDSVDIEEPPSSSGAAATTGHSLNASGQLQPSGMVLPGSSSSVDSKSRDTPPPPPSHLLTTLLQKKTPLDMSCLRKDDANKHDGTESLLCPTPKKMDHQPVQPGVTPSAGAPTLTMLLNTSSSGASLGIRPVPGVAAGAVAVTTASAVAVTTASVPAVTTASAAVVRSVASATPATSVPPVVTSAAVVVTAAGTPALYSIAVPTMMTSLASVVPAMSEPPILMEPEPLEPASAPAAFRSATDVPSDVATTTAAVREASRAQVELPAGLPVTFDVSMPADINQPVDVCIDVDEAPAATDEVVVESDVVAAEPPLEADLSAELWQVDALMLPAADPAAAHPPIAHPPETAKIQPEQSEDLMEIEDATPAATATALATTAQSVLTLPETMEEQQHVQTMTEPAPEAWHVHAEQPPATDAAAAIVTATVAPPGSPKSVAPAPASASPPSAQSPSPASTVQPHVEEVPVGAAVNIDESQTPAMPSLIVTEVVELKPVVDKPTSPDVAQQPEVSQPPASTKHGGRTTASKRSGDAGRTRRSSRGPKKLSETTSADETSVTDQFTVATSAAAGAGVEEPAASILSTATPEPTHREKHQPEACPQPEDVKTPTELPVSVKMISEEIKDATGHTVVEADEDSKTSAHVSLIPPSLSAVSVASSAPVLAAASPVASPTTVAPSVPAAVASESIGTKHTLVAAGGSAESLPCSPASVPHSDDSEEEKSYKAWRKAITLVWRAVATHKHANEFLHPVTDDIAPGYTAIVYRPMDLMTIKKNIENGTIRTTAEFQRDMMLMFTNAIMYNGANHEIYGMTISMYDDAMKHIEQFVHAQLMLKEQEAKVVTLRGRRETAEKDDDRRRPSYDHHGEGSKRKRTRADDDK